MVDSTVYRDRVADLCGELPEAAAVPAAPNRLAFLVRGRAFAHFLVDHRGDGRVAVAVETPPGAQQRLVSSHPGRYHVPAGAGGFGWVALRLDRPRVDWSEVSALLRDAYRLAAPPHLATMV
jgi:hypothetical protein